MRRDERGTVLLLTVFLGFVLVVLTAVVVDASAAFLARRSLSSAADGAALHAAQEVDLDAYYAGSGALLPLADPRDAVEDYVATHVPGAAVVDVATDGTTVTVTLATRVDLPLRPPGYAATVTVTATATARLLRHP